MKKNIAVLDPTTTNCRQIHETKQVVGIIQAKVPSVQPTIKTRLYFGDVWQNWL